MVTSITSLLKSSPEIAGSLPNKCIVYSNIRKRVIDIKERLGNVFDADDNLHQFEVLSIHGHLPKLEKSRYMQMFLNPTHPDDKNVKVLCATSGVGNVGIDSPDIREVFRLEFPPSLLDIVQESGRAGRLAIPDPANFKYTLYFSLHFSDARGRASIETPKQSPKYFLQQSHNFRPLRVPTKCLAHK